MACYVFNFNLHDLNLVEIGKQKCTPLYSFGPFIRNEYIFHYVISGKGYCSMGHDVQESSVQKPDQPSGGPTAHEVRAGEGFLIEPHTKHIYNADLNDPWHYIWVVFSGASAPHLLRSYGKFLPVFGSADTKCCSSNHRKFQQGNVPTTLC